MDEAGKGGGRSSEPSTRPRELGELSAVIAHQLRSPLAGIAATAQALRDWLYDGATPGGEDGPPTMPPLPRGEGRGEGALLPSPAPVPAAEGDEWWRESVDVILEEVQRLERVVHHLIDFARTRRPRLAPSDLKDDLARVLRRVAASAAAAGVEVRIEVPREQPPVLIDSELMAHVFHNLAANAIQAMRPGGALTLRARAPDGDSAFVCVEFADTGHGIPPEDLPRIFEPFFTRRADGIGLGLATAASLAEAQGGYITVESTPGVGSCFSVYVRRADAARRPGEAEH